MFSLKPSHCIAATLSAALINSAAPAWAADSFASGFENPKEISGFSLTGNVSVDASKAHDGTSSLKIEPMSRAELKLANADGAGRVEFWVYDDMKMPGDVKARRAGPRWGLKMSNGRILSAGCFYAPYLSGEKTYAISESPDGKMWLAKVAYLGESRRSAGWHHWVFTLDPDKGASVAFDGKDVNAARPRYDWNQSEFTGFSSVVFLGDDAKDGATLWIDDLKASTSGKMNVAPTPPPPPPPVVPDRDPPAEKIVRLNYKSLSVHPRLLFGPEDVSRMRRFVESPEGKPLMEGLLRYRGASKPPAKPQFLADATDGQRQGLWRLPTVALHYVLTGDKASFDDALGFLELFQSLPHWETGQERDSGMSSANILIGAALAYDWLYDDLDPAFRETFRQTLWQKARAQYHGGHLMKNPGTHYWQSDPQNNHRWHRDAGMTLAALAAATGAPSEQWLLGKISDELDFIARWLPEDGTSHESASYLVFGATHLTLALHAGDRGFGKRHLENPFFKNVGAFRIHSLLPGLADGFSYGDGAGLGNYNNFLFKAAAVHRQPALAGAIEKMRQAAPSAFEYFWFDIIWKDPGLKPADITAFPTTGLYPDIGTLFIRESWRDDAVAAMFRCGPLGGHTLNKFRNENDFRYINVAHDDPDANSFILFAGSKALAETDRYSRSKKSANYNTILVNGIGQEALGRPEGGVWTQPAVGKTDMTTMACLTAWKQTPAVTVIEGEAAGSYLALNDARRGASRPALERFRRTFIWVEGKYILVLDDIRAPSEVAYDWLMQGPDLVIDDEAGLRFRLVNGAVECPFQIASTTPLQIKLRKSPADDRGKPLGWRQLVASATTPSLRMASVYSPWGGTRAVKLEAVSADTAKVVVSDNGVVTDTWLWASAKTATSPSLLKRNAATGVTTFQLAASDLPPKP
ncbi:MAG: hypothetical protein ACOX9C_09980 [Kiritimatiellia bacterium]|jgi:hypothetical protein